LKQKKQKFKAVSFSAKNQSSGLKFANSSRLLRDSDSANFLTPQTLLFLTPKRQGRFPDLKYAQVAGYHKD